MRQMSKKGKKSLCKAFVSAILAAGLSFGMTAAAAGEGSITVRYLYGGEAEGTYAMEGVSVTASRVADILSDGSYSLAEDYSACGLTEAELESIDLSGDNSAIIAKLSSCSSGESWTVQTDSSGVAVFGNLPDGLYLIAEETITSGDYTYTGASKLVALPSTDDKTGDECRELTVHVSATKSETESGDGASSGETVASGSGSTGGTSTSSVKTGDTTPLAWTALLMLVAMAVFSISVRRAIHKSR